MRIIILLFTSIYISFNSNAQTDQVQIILQKLAKSKPELVGYIPETGRAYLITPREEAVPAAFIPQLQDAFYKDAGELCKIYGQRYLADWRALLSKAARESFWGASYLCNRANNYFGIRSMNKSWACESFFFCETVLRNDPEPSDFIIFEDFESSLWMFIHTIYSDHFLERLPDYGTRVAQAIRKEREMSVHYWEFADYDIPFVRQLPAAAYTYDELIYTWSEHEINNLCVNCDRQTDRNWIAKVERAEKRVRK
ncbi:MAG: glucosaminidase domain-containing protein [Saprospiraceae bacterium]|nr:glucosaminidase domain-containing protein [Saprospiraceae bacterium]